MGLRSDRLAAGLDPLSLLRFLPHSINFQQFYIPHGYKELTVPQKDGVLH